MSSEENRHTPRELLSALDKSIARSEEPYDVEAGLDRLNRWIDIDAESPSDAASRDPGSESRPEKSNSDSDGLELLVAAANAGDRSSLNKILAIVRPLVVRYCRSRIKRAQDADDVAQEICLAVLTALPNYRDQGRPFLAFVYGISAHKVVDYVRATNRRREDFLTEGDRTRLEESPGPVESYAQVIPIRAPKESNEMIELSVRMSSTLGLLSEVDREILILRIIVGLSAEETAAAVGSTAGGVIKSEAESLSRLRTLGRDVGWMKSSI